MKETARAFLADQLDMERKSLEYWEAHKAEAQKRLDMANEGIARVQELIGELESLIAEDEVLTPA